MKALIIDDEQKARKLLSVLLHEHCPEITELEVAADLPEGIKKIHQFRPNVIFLDVEMPEYSGLELTKFINVNEFEFEIIFTTAYAHYAVQAFELSAVDYLLKPLRPDKLKEAVSRVASSFKKNHLAQQLEALKSCFERNEFNKIGIPNSDGILFLNIDEIIVIEADGPYSKVYSKNTEMILVSKPMKYFVDLLISRQVFYKPHRSYLINLKFVRQFVKKDGGYILMDNDQVISISKENRDSFLAIINRLN
ncbi:MAG: LytR/AlgR family response regulator transcription factor [Flammeovirgaceae bacterium]